MQNSEFVSKSIKDLLEKRYALERNYIPHVVSPLSVSENSRGKKRLILALRYVNSHIYKEYIKFDDWRFFKDLIIEDGFLYKFDFKSGYHHVDIFVEHQIFLGFKWGLKYYVFTVLPFGLATAPFIFTKIFRPLLSFWHSRGIKICLYLEDGVGIEKTHEEAERNSKFVRETLSNSGITCNYEKSIWEPTKCLTWLGITINLEKNKIFIPEQRVSSVFSCINSVLSTPYTTAGRISTLVGMLLSMKCVLNIVRLKTRYLYRCIDCRSS